MGNKVETKSSWLWIDDDGVVYVQSKPDVHETLAHAVENTRLLMKLGSGARRAMIVDARQLKSQDKAALSYYKGGLNANILLSAAYVIPSRLGTFIGNLIIGKTSPVPAKLFTDLAEAQRWTREQKAQMQAAGASPVSA